MREVYLDNRWSAVGQSDVSVTSDGNRTEISIRRLCSINNCNLSHVLPRGANLLQHIPILAIHRIH
jgi:hypothetical protein